MLSFISESLTSFLKSKHNGHLSTLMNEKAVEIYAYMSAMMGAYSAMAVEERAALESWEKENLNGHNVATSD